MMTGTEDRFSNLPEHLIDSILERVPFDDAVRTSIMSTKWRYRWANMKELILDKQFLKKIAKNGAFGCDGFMRIINQVLILHKGPTLKLHLYINRHYEIPAHVFSCPELTELKLDNGFFKPPLEFKGYLNLGKLCCNNITFGPNMCATQINFPQLEELSLFNCTNVNNFKMKAEKLRTLFVTYCPDAMLLLQLLDCPYLTSLMVCGIQFRKLTEDLEWPKAKNLTTILSNFPRIRELVIDGHLLKFLVAEKIPEWPPQAVKHLKCLGLLDFQPSDLDQLHGGLRLLRNSPNLTILSILQSEMKAQVVHYDVGPALNHLQDPNCLDSTLKCLKYVNIGCLEGSQPELLFIKLLLARSPCLKKLAITPSRSCDAQKRNEIAEDVMRFPRASPKAEIICLDPQPHPGSQLCFSFNFR